VAVFGLLNPPDFMILTFALVTLLCAGLVARHRYATMFVSLITGTTLAGRPAIAIAARFRRHHL